MNIDLVKGRKVGRLASLSLSELSDMAINKPEEILIRSLHYHQIILLAIIITNIIIITIIIIIIKYQKEIWRKNLCKMSPLLPLIISQHGAQHQIAPTAKK